MNHEIRNLHDTMFPFGIRLFNMAGIFQDVQWISVPTSTAVGLAADSSNFRWACRLCSVHGLIHLPYVYLP